MQQDCLKEWKMNYLSLLLVVLRVASGFSFAAGHCHALDTELHAVPGARKGLQEPTWQTQLRHASNRGVKNKNEVLGPLY